MTVAVIAIIVCLVYAALTHRAIRRRASYWRQHDQQIRIRRALWRGTEAFEKFANSMRRVATAFALAAPTAAAFQRSLRAASKAQAEAVIKARAERRMKLSSRQTTYSPEAD